MRPLIGITTTLGPRHSTVLGVERPVFSLDGAYVDAVAVAGGCPVLLPAVDPALVEAVVDGVDALVLSGGGDVDPAHYGAERHAETRPADPVRDVFELELVRAARARDLPILAVCRGMQVLNVACGGSLVQHVPDQAQHDHLDITHWDVAANPVSVTAGTVLHDLVGHTQITVNSLHHQACDRVADGFQVSAVDADGIVEAIEHLDRSPVLGVQWHPELLQGEPTHQALFVWLVNRARDRRAAPRL